VTATLAGSKLTINGTFEGLKGNATVAHIHQGSAAGVRGPKLLDLTVTKATSGNLSGSFDLTPDQVDALKKGRWYVQIHSEKAPAGNLWGWLVKQDFVK
jgi:CHRD domain